MTKEAFLYAMDKLTVPEGERLWLYGEAGLASGTVYTPYKPQAESFTRTGLAVIHAPEQATEKYDAVFINSPRQRDEAEGAMALALSSSKGFVMAAARNDAGGGRLLRDMEAYGVQAQSLSKYHCRIVWTMQAGEADKARIQAQRAKLDMRPVKIEETEWWTVPGLFGWDRADPGSKLLLAHLPGDMEGTLADFGCGYGYLSKALKARFPAIARLDAFDWDARAVAACARNVPEVHAEWEDIRHKNFSPRYQAVVMNPPFHDIHAADPELGRIFIRKAWESLLPGGRLFLVANRHLPYEQALPGLKILHQGEGYKIIHGRKP